MDLQWTPQKPHRLITWAQEVTLYQLEPCDPPPSKTRHGCIRLSETCAASLMAKVGDYPFAKVIDSYPGTEAEGMIAIGLGNGKIILTTLGASIISKEFVPKHTRQVNSLQWNKHAPNLLVAGLDKARSDYAVSIWDVSGSSKFVNGFHDAIRPITELGMSETAHSVHWANAKTLLVGMNGKHIKLFDIRADPQPKLSNTASTKAVNGICIDDLEAHRMASFADNQAYVWDMRNFEKPYVVLNHSKPIIKIGWCPTRNGLLACLEKDSSYVTLHDVHHATLSSEEGDAAVLERRLSPSYSTGLHVNTTAPLSAFAWHPTECNVLTTASSAGALWNSVVYERITLNWSSTSKMGWSDGKKLIHYIDNTDDQYSVLNDISILIRNRALAGYGLKNPLKENAKCVGNDEQLKHVWEWLEFCKSLTEKFHVPYLNGTKFPGAMSVLKIDASTLTSPLKSEIVHNNSFDLHSSKTYKSDERSFIQHLCGWGSDLPSASHGSPTRKAAIALFHLKLRQAIRILNDSNHSIVAMAIAGFSEDRSSLWRELAQTNCSQLSDPYIRAIFAFLTEADSSYETILHETQLSVSDRLGFACSFLPDNKLVTFIHQLSSEMLRRGNLDGILLTGMTPQAIPLMQKYLDITGDIQTVAMLAIRTLAEEIPASYQLKFWIEKYRELLDSWKLWEHRAEFDICKNKNNSSLIPQPDVTLLCNFCGKPITPSSLSGMARNTQQLFSRFTTTNAKLKLSCCPNCRKPLPRCAVCLMHMGTILGTGIGTEPTAAIRKPGFTPEALSWYTWCQTCRHGGHAVHLSMYFETHSECPVTGCSCKCASLDKVAGFRKK